MIEQTKAISTERALKLALEALECTEYPQDHYDAITALREALALVNKVDQEQPAQQEQEKDWDAVAIRQTTKADIGIKGDA